MFKITRIFASDICAGSNILQQAHLPISAPDGGDPSQHGVIFAVNGTCKTTLISFLLNTFYPDKKRFVQHLQSGGDKTLEQYLVPGRPALILVDMALPDPGQLFEDAPQQHLVIGQLLYRYREASKPLTRIYFQAQSPALFDELAKEWPALVEDDSPLAAAREFLGPRTVHTEIQKEWLDRLERMGLDPWLMNRQIDFARSEGGIKDAFRFRSEAEFLSFFLGCVTDMAFADQLRQATLTSMEKMQDLPRKKARLNAVLSLQSRLQAFETIAGRWRAARMETDGCAQSLDQAAHLVGRALPQAQRRRSQAKTELNRAQTEKKEARNGLAILKADQLKARAFALELEEQGLKSQISELNQSMAAMKTEINALDAAGLLAELELIAQQLKDKEAALTTSGKELTPLREKARARAAEYHACLAQLREKARSAMDAARTEQRAATGEINPRRTALKTAARSLGDLEKQIQSWSAKLAMADQAQKNLEGLDGDSPEQIRQRLEHALDQLNKDLSQNRDKLQDLRNHMAGENKSRETLLAQRSQEQAKLASAQARQDEEAQRRQTLRANAQIRTVAGSDDFEPSNPAHISAISQAMERLERTLRQTEKSIRTLEEELGLLDEIHSLTVDEETLKLIAHYRELGVPADQIRAYPEYLASLELDGPAIAERIHRDPARFTGILAQTPEVLEQILSLDAPPWLKRPVVVSLPQDPDQAVTEIPHARIVPSDPTIYTREGAEQFRSRITAEKEGLEAQAQEAIERISALRRAMDALTEYRKSYPHREAVKALEADVALAQSALETSDAALTNGQERMDQLQEKVGLCQDRNGELQGKEGQLKGQLSQVKAWLAQYGDGQSWEGQIQANQARIREEQARMTRLEEEIQNLEQAANEAAQRIPALEKDLERLDELAGEIPLPPETEALPAPATLDPAHLKALYLQAREDVTQMSTGLGMAALEQEVQRLGTDGAALETRMARFRADHEYEENQAASWAKRPAPDRDREKARLGEAIQAEKEKQIRAEARADLAAADRAQAQIKLKDMEKKGIRPKLATRDLEAMSPEAVALNLEADLEKEKLALEGRQTELDQGIQRHREALQTVENWVNQLKTLEARVGDAPKTAPREMDGDWPDLTHPENPMVHCREMEDRIKALKEELTRGEQRTRALEKERNSKFEELTGQILDPEMGSTIPALVDGIREHDADSLGESCALLMEHCAGIARTLEGDLERSRSLMDTHINLLLEHAKDCHQKLKSATRVTIPEPVFTYGGHPILKARLRLNFDRSGQAYREALEHWMEERIQTGFCPQVNPTQGNGLGADILYRLLELESGKTFNIRLLKCDDTARNYEPVGRDMGSGGEALTTSVLLYALLVSMRRNRFKGGSRPMPGFLILDNPLGVCNRPAFLDAQLKVADALGVQCIYFTGINDTGSIELFEHRIVIRKAGRQFNLDGRPYEKLETVQIHVEDNPEPNPA